MPNEDDNIVFAGASPIDIAPEPPVIRLDNGKRPENTFAAIEALHAAGVPFYRRGDGIMFVAKVTAKASDGSEILIPGTKNVAPYYLLHELGLAARFEKWDARKRANKVVDPPEDLAKRIMAMPNEWPFAPLTGIIGTPTMRYDGSLLTEPGYDPATGYYLVNPPDMPMIPEYPSRADALECLALLADLLSEFPFVDEVARSVALSGLMSPVLRPALGDAVPLHVYSAPKGGTGKSFLTDLCSKIAIGERCPVISFTTRNPEENEKRLQAAALGAQSIISIDNCDGRLRGGQFLQQLITQPLLQIRKLHTSELFTVANGLVVFANGNNIVVGESDIRRAIQCALDANTEDTYKRRFRADPLALVAADRGLYVMCILTIARAYLMAGAPGAPGAPAPFMSFARWSKIVRGSLIWLGCTDPVKSTETLAAEDPDAAKRIVVFEALLSALLADERPYTVAAIIKAAEHDERLSEALAVVASGKDKPLDRYRLGNWFRHNRNRRVERESGGGLKLVMVPGRMHEWKLEREATP
jgi:putative DNA primase/helicase